MLNSKSDKFSYKIIGYEGHSDGDEAMINLMALLDEIELTDDHSLAAHRFDIIEAAGYEVEYGPEEELH